jgi:hypothetical protein
MLRQSQRRSLRIGRLGALRPSQNKLPSLTESENFPSHVSIPTKIGTDFSAIKRLQEIGYATENGWTGWGAGADQARTVLSIQKR